MWCDGGGVMVMVVVVCVCVCVYACCYDALLMVTGI